MFELFCQAVQQAAQARGSRVALDASWSLPSGPPQASVCALQIDQARVLLAALHGPVQRDEVLARVDVLLESVLALRKGLTAAAAVDLYLLLLAPEGSSTDPAWQALANEIERDDRMARKHVWLPNAEGSNVKEFLAATFLACPWQVERGADTALALLGDDFAMPPGWSEILLQGELEGVELVQALLQLERAA